MLANVNSGPGPQHPLTDFNNAYIFTWRKGKTFEISAVFNTTWVSYIYVFDAATHNVVAELTNDGGNTMYVAGENLHDTDLRYGIVNYHKVNISPGRENADDDFVQGILAKQQVQNTGPGGREVAVGFSDGHGRDDNALAVLQIAGEP